MNKWLQALLGVAAIAVLALAATWFADRDAAIKAAAKAVEQRKQQAMIERDIEMARLKRGCTNPVLAWHNGYRDVAEKAFGKENAYDAVLNCEALFPELKR